MLRLRSREDAWRLECPQGHKSIAPTNHHWWCRYCANWGLEPEYQHAIDAETGDELTRDEVSIEVAVGEENEPV